MLVEETSTPDAALPVEGFRAHLRLGTGFADDAVQDPVLISFLKAALAAIEARTGKILLIREFSWTLSAWRDVGAQALPIAPVREIIDLAIIDADETESIVELSTYRLERDHQRPKVVAHSGALPAIPRGGSAEIVFTAGFADSFDALPADLAQAVFLLAAHYYENRGDTSLTGAKMPYGVAVLIERYKTVRLLAGGRS